MSDEEPKTDLDAWEAQAPPDGFAERVIERLRGEMRADDRGRTTETSGVAAPPRPEAAVDAGESSRDARPAASAAKRSAARRWGAGGLALGAVALAAAIAVRVNAPVPSHGAAIAKDRMEISVGTRARAVLEPGADVKWDGDDVIQVHGDVFYRVEPGARFRVHTPAGDVEVKGTCFAVKIRGEGPAGSTGSMEGDAMEKRDVKSAAIGAALSALAFVAVYEGKVAVSNAGQTVDLKAGETAQAGPNGVRASGGLGAGERNFDDMAAAVGEEPLSKANESLVSQIGEYRRRLEAITAQKIDLEQTLKNTEQKLASVSADGSAPRAHAEFDLGADEWKELAKDGTVKFMTPCVRPPDKAVSPEQLQKVALAPQDAPVLKSAYAKSNERLWAVLRPLCAQAVGSAEVADKLGPDTCKHVILDQAKEKDSNAANEAMRQVGEMRAGLRPMPTGDVANPVIKMFLALTGEIKLFENELAQSFGPEEAHRITFAEGMCMHSSTFGGPGPREPEAK